MNCPLCEGPGFVLGQLGRLMHFRCRNCGIDFSISVYDLLDEEELDDGTPAVRDEEGNLWPKLF